MRLELDFVISVSDFSRFRVNAFHTQNGLAAVFRLIPVRVRTLEELGTPEVFKQFASYGSGIVLVTGPTGSGKSTTLAAIVNYINDHYHKHILTIEDPVEFVHLSKKSLVNQREVGKHTLGFQNALRSALREDPDVILIGELRDVETVRLALEAAETGHLVLASLHTSSAAKTVDRIVGIFPAEERDLVHATCSPALYKLSSHNYFLNELMAKDVSPAMKF